MSVEVNDQVQSLVETVFAQPGDPGLGVHVLSQFVFCQRAGVIEWEKNQLDSGVEEDLKPRANLDFVPRYDLGEIHRAIDREVARIMAFIPFPITAAVATVVCWERYGFWAASLGIVLTIILWRKVRAMTRRLSPHRAALAEALSFAPRIPDPDCLAEQDAHWWEMLNAGFRSRKLKDKLDHPELRMSGNPWRVLTMGDLRIPVFQDRHATNRANAKLYPKHYARMAAYCHLLERSMGGRSPYGIILYGDSFEGTAIAKDAPESWSEFKNGILEARETIKGLGAQPPKLPKAAPPNFCSGCHLGNPFSTESRSGDKTYSLPVFGVQGADGRIYHSTCGARFQWLPPHDKVDQKSIEI